MAIIRKSELKSMDQKQLLNKKGELQKEMIKINAQRSTKTTPENPGRIREVKKTIARINTIVNVMQRVPQEHKAKGDEKLDKKKLKEVKKKTS
jgi:large subunit ribosomal protein L29